MQEKENKTIRSRRHVLAVALILAIVFISVADISTPTSIEFGPAAHAINSSYAHFYSHASGNSTPKAFLRSVLYFSVVLLTVTIIGTVFTNGTIKTDFTAAAVLAASLLGVILFLGAAKLVDL